MSKSNLEKIMVEFDEEFTQDGEILIDEKGTETPKDIKAFIKKTYSTAQRDKVDELKGEIEKKRKKEYPLCSLYCDGRCCEKENTFRDGVYNECIDEVLITLENEDIK